MPNWCNNKITVVGTPDDISGFVAAARGMPVKYAPQPWDNEEKEREPVEFSFHALVPLPESAIGSDYTKTGYDAEHQTWGIKWGACDIVAGPHSDRVARYAFDTAWSPGQKFWEKVVAKWPRLIFMLSYWEEYPSRGRWLGVDGQMHYLIDEQAGSETGPQQPDFDSDEAEEDWFEKVKRPWWKQLRDTHDTWAMLVAEHQEMTVQLDHVEERGSVLDWGRIVNLATDYSRVEASTGE